ncbi:acyl-CoA synthetase (NDP forming) [Mycolicibacterium rhodesiae NBB3]|uniref:Acyl-CoA synthetase (NDP forming) n=1 Tax=Mycolicibacterium rhodesiae (strain NBB3) TaxID=710685 RepID=G8RJD3_MYCRN|nr:acetate--CoA ligase family protein [Mycolicibacterium rhodesiae]AEV73503.1 acyl-CoA synthetase (NDP forming) [Mycolicibacterium rhodesiae NBB3]
MRLLTALFTPRRVLLVGASRRPGTLGRLLTENLGVFPGELICKSSGDVLGEDCRDVDLAVLAVPSRVIPSIVDQLACKAKVIVVLSAGFAETGAAGRDLQAEVIAAARPARVIGPNCFGVQDCNALLNASIAAGLPLAGGGIALVSQAGTYAMAARAYSHDDRVRFSKVIALGNASDVSAAELMAELRTDPASTTLCFAVESLPDARAFIEQVRLTTPRKPVVVYKAGQTDAGARSAASHTGAVAAPSSMLRDALAQAGAVQVSSGEELFDAAQVFDMQRPLAGPRIGVVSNSGGAAVEMVDALAQQGLSVPVLSDPLRDRIAAQLPGFASARNPVDITPVWSQYSQLYPEIVEILAESGELDAVVVLLTHRAAGDEETVQAIASRCGMSKRPTVPIYVCTIAGRAVRATLHPLQDAGIPCFDGPTRTARALGHVYRYTQARARGITPLQPLPDPPHPRLSIDRNELAQLLTRFGISITPSRLCRSLHEVEQADVQFPAVIKIAAAEHRTELDGVRLNIKSQQELIAHAADLITRAGSDGGLLVQPQLTGVEIMVGAVRDSSLGPVVMVGLGGIWVEILNDIAFALAPIRHDDAIALISGLAGYPILSGARGTFPINLDRLASVVVQVGQLCAEYPDISTLTLNPVIVTGTDAVAVDWKSTSP